MQATNLCGQARPACEVTQLHVKIVVQLYPASRVLLRMLERFEALFTTRLIDTVEEDPGATAEVKLVRLMELVLAGPDDAKLEIAVRAWALQDGEARQAQERVDRTRTQYLRKLCRGLESSLIAPDRLAELLYLILIGAEQVLPPVPSDELRDLYADTLRLATGKSLL